MKPHSFTYTIAAWSRTTAYGTDQSIVAFAATRRGVMSEYKRHLARFAGTDPRYVAVNLYKDGELIERLVQPVNP